MRISICIPTRERAHYLRECLATLVAIDDPDVEIIVSDNASADDTETVVRSFDDPRVRYINTGARLSMRQNFEFAVAATTGDYVIMIGDDDAMQPGQFALLRAILEAERPECLTWRPRTYRWVEGERLSRGGFLTQTRAHCFGKPVRMTIAQSQAAALKSIFAVGSFAPQIYHGTIRRDVLERLKAKTDEIFCSSVPDVYLSVAIGAVADDLMFIEHPFSISGAGKRSTGVSQAIDGPARAGGAADLFAREAGADPVQDPMPGRMPTLGLSLLNAVEQANRIAYGGALAIAYPVMIRECLDELQKKSQAEFTAGIAHLARLAESLPGSDALKVQIASAAHDAATVERAAAKTRAHKRFQGIETALRQSWVTPRKVWFLVDRFGTGEIALATDVLDWCLGPIARGEGEAVRKTLGSPRLWHGVLRRSAALASRSLVRLGAPQGLAKASRHALASLLAHDVTKTS